MSLGSAAVNRLRELYRRVLCRNARLNAPQAHRPLFDSLEPRLMLSASVSSDLDNPLQEEYPVGQALTVADTYEPDDTPGEATWITIDGSSQAHSLTDTSDVDWLEFTVQTEAGGMLYIPHSSNEIAVWDPTTGSLVTTLTTTVGLGAGLASDADAGLLYATGAGATTYVLDINTGQVVDTISTIMNPEGLAVANGTLLIAGYDGGILWMLPYDLASGEMGEAITSVTSGTCTGLGAYGTHTVAILPTEVKVSMGGLGEYEIDPLGSWVI